MQLKFEGSNNEEHKIKYIQNSAVYTIKSTIK